MVDDSKTPVTLVGQVRVRDHCTFSWKEPKGSGQRSVEALPIHCAECVAEVRKRGYVVVVSEHLAPLPKGK